MPDSDLTPERRFPRWAGGLIALILILFIWLVIQVRREPGNTASGIPAAADTVEGAPSVTGPAIPVVTGIDTVTAAPPDSTSTAATATTPPGPGASSGQR